jgi:large subunit ribosomal protein L23
MAGIHLYDVIVRPVVTEKTNLMADEQRQYTFEVDLRANKVQIKEAVEVIFDVRVQKIATMVVPAKRGTRGRRTYQRKKAWKKAIVTLEAGQSIDLFNL